MPDATKARLENAVARSAAGSCWAASFRPQLTMEERVPVSGGASTLVDHFLESTRRLYLCLKKLTELEHLIIRGLRGHERDHEVEVGSMPVEAAREGRALAITEHDAVAEIGMDGLMGCRLLAVGDRVMSCDATDLGLDENARLPSTLVIRLDDRQVGFECNGARLGMG